MKKKFFAVLLTAALGVSCLAGCGSTPAAPAEPTQGAAVETQPAGETQPAATEVDPESIPDTMEAADGVYKIALVTDIGQLKDGSFNQSSWNGVKLFANANGLSYKYYQPANGSEATDDDRYDAMKAAVDGGAELIVAPGFAQYAALAKAAVEFADVKFLFLDGWMDDVLATNNNVAAIAYQEEQCGYFAGYAAVMDGFTKLGFCGGGGGTNAACQRYGFGYVQGAAAAAEKLGTPVEVNYTWLYGADFQGTPELQTLADGWYTNGTEVIFSCGGSICNYIFAAASANSAYTIGVDVDQSGDSATVITSAMKGLAASVQKEAGVYFAGQWDTIGGTLQVLGAAEDATGLPTDTWSFETFTVAEYEELFAAVVDGSLKIDANYDDFASFDAGNDFITVNVVE